MPLGPDHFSVIDLPPLDEATRNEFENLRTDQYATGSHRYRRFSQYRLTAASNAWRLELLPHRPFLQSREFNPLVGGIQRNFEPLRIDPSPQIIAGAEAISLDKGHDWQINVHQCRVITDENIRGLSVPEGPHRDGHTFGMVAVFGRDNISGGQTQLFKELGSESFYETVLKENQAIVYDDAKMFHNATDIEPLTKHGGHRDLWIVAFNEWRNRRYGDDFEARAMA